MDLGPGGWGAHETPGKDVAVGIRGHRFDDQHVTLIDGGIGNGSQLGSVVFARDRRQRVGRVGHGLAVAKMVHGDAFEGIAFAELAYVDGAKTDGKRFCWIVARISVGR